MNTHVVLFAILLFVVGCDNSSTPPLSSIQSQSDPKSAILYEPDGRTVAVGVKIWFFDLSTDNDIPADSFTTDISGKYSIGDLSPGKYHLWAEKDSFVLFQDSIRVTEDSANLRNDTLDCASSLSGIVSVHPDHDPRTVTIRLVNSQKYLKIVTKNGRFTLRGLAKGTYVLQARCSTPGYAPFSSKVSINACSNDTLVSALKLNYIGIPVITHPKISQDTLGGSVQISWDKISNSTLQDYLVYKDECRDFGFSEELIAVTKDTFFIDKNVGQMVNPFDTVPKCIAYRIATRTTTQDTGPTCSNINIQLAPKSFVTTFFKGQVIYNQPDCYSATINDTVLLSINVRNRTRQLKSIQWFDDRRQKTIAILNVDTLNTNAFSDTIACTFDSLGTNRVSAIVYDGAETRWSTYLNVDIVADEPEVSICNDTGVLIGKPVHLCGSAYQKFGSIVRWEWKIGSQDWIKTSAADTVIIAPITEQILICSLAVTDDDGYRIKKSMRIVTSYAAQAVSACSSHSFILKNDKTLLGFGSGESGQLGNGSSSLQLFPSAVMSNVQSMIAGVRHSMFIRTDGSLWACGDNSYGQLGDGTNEKRNPPIPVMNDVAKVAAGNYHTLILKTDATLWACGDNSHGQLGDGTKKNHSTPVLVMNGVQSMSAGAFHSVILKTDGTVWTCGENGGGQLGTGTTMDSLLPVQVMNSISCVAAGSWHTLFLSITGELWGCGNNGYGQLGDGTIDRRLYPIKLMSGIKEMAASVYYSLILTNDKTLMICGLNPSGTTQSDKRYLPYPIMTEVISMAAGWYHCLILKNDGTVLACGKNNTGQLGDGSLKNRNIPVCIMPAQANAD